MGTRTYTFTVTNDAGVAESRSIDITTVSGTTPLEVLNGVLFNAGGPIGTGGLDLDNGEGTGSEDIAAEIKDIGIDVDGNWLQVIGRVNDALLYQMVAGEDGVSESFTFASIDSKETLAGLVGSGLNLVSSGTVNVGDVFVVDRAGSYYAFEVAEVNVIQADNSDNYVLNIVK